MTCTPPLGEEDTYKLLVILMNHYQNPNLLDLGGIQFSKENFLSEGEMGPVCWDFWCCSFIYKAVFLVFESRRVPGIRFLRNIIKTKWQCILMFLRKLLIYSFPLQDDMF